MGPERPKSQWEMDFEAAVQRASERLKLRKASLAEIERKAGENADFALHTASVLYAKSRYRRRRGRRYLYSRFGIKVHCGGRQVRYEQHKPERFPKGSQERLLCARAVVEHGEWENIWRALRCGFDSFGPPDQARMACKFAGEAMRQSPALWGYFTEKEREPDDTVRAYATAELVGWLDNEVKLYPRTRKPGGDREQKLWNLASAALAAWHDLQPDEAFYLPNKFVKQFNGKRKKGSLAGRGGSYFDPLPDLPVKTRRDSKSGKPEVVDPDIVSDDGGLAEFEAKETIASQQLDAYIEKAGLSSQQKAVLERLRAGEEQTDS